MSDDDDGGGDEFAPVRHLVPDGAIPVSFVCVIRFLDADGEEQIKAKHSGGDTSIATTVGMLELAKAAYIDDAGPWADGD